MREHQVWFKEANGDFCPRYLDRVSKTTCGECHHRQLIVINSQAQASVRCGYFSEEEPRQP